MRFRFLPILLLVAALTGTAFAGNQGPGIGPDEALQRLMAGNARFVAEAPARQNLTAKRLATAQHGQTPYATILSCADSRAPVELIFDEGVGDLFVIRVAGNVAATDEVGTAEYGADHLGVPLLVVMGHTQCGAVTAVVQGAEVHGSIPMLVAPIVPAVAAAEKSNPKLDRAALVPKAIEANVWQAIDDTMRQSPIIRTRVAEGKLKVVGAIYHLDDGKVEWLGEHPQQARLLSYTSGPAQAHK
ncbi:MAG TPA: carbonic anhydrase [Nitratidesulfovibrio sp.]|nr:carbonic anhydrase [Nitratidesulfovibrio sp.]